MIVKIKILCYGWWRWTAYTSTNSQLQRQFNLKNFFTCRLSCVTEAWTISRRKNRRVRQATQVEDRRCGASRASVRRERPRTPRWCCPPPPPSCCRGTCPPAPGTAGVRQPLRSPGTAAASSRRTRGGATRSHRCWLRRWWWLGSVCCWRSSISWALTWAWLVFLLWSWLNLELREWRCCRCYGMTFENGIVRTWTGVVLLGIKREREGWNGHNINDEIKNWELESGQHESLAFGLCSLVGVFNYFHAFFFFYKFKTYLFLNCFINLKCFDRWDDRSHLIAMKELPHTINQ